MSRGRAPTLPTPALSVRVRITSAAALVGLVGSLVGGWLLVRALGDDIEQSLLESAAQESASLTEQLASGVSPTTLVVRGPPDRLVQVVGPGGVLLAQDHPEVAEPAVGRPGRRTAVRVTGLDDTYAVHARAARGGRLVVVGLSEERRAAATSSAVRHLAVGIPAAVALLALVVWVAVGRALAPVETMRRQGARITGEHLHRRLPVPQGRDEIPHLAQTLNSMLDHIEEGQEAQRRFVSDASHELRSPLAILRQRVEVARRHPDGTTVVGLADEVGAEQQRMESLVAALLTLARLDDGLTPLGAVVDLDDLVLAEADRVRHTHPGVNLDLAQVSAGQVRGDAVLLAQVVTNLLGNAARHAHDVVRVALRETGADVVLTVDDDGDGIAPEHRERVFDRFTRLDEARSRDRGGAGLGLAIVRRVVTLHAGTVHVDDAPSGGASFTVRLPRAE